MLLIGKPANITDVYQGGGSYVVLIQGLTFRVFLLPVAME